MRASTPAHHRPYPDDATVLEELCHLLQSCAFCQACDVDGAVLRVILLFGSACVRTHTHKERETQNV